MRRFVHEGQLPVDAASAFAWHARPGALPRLIPPWEAVAVESATGGIEDGAEVVLRLRMGPLRLRWVAEHGDYRPNESFLDVQRSGPFARWEHTHRFLPEGETCRLRDDVIYKLPLGPVGAILGGASVRAKLRAQFRFRHAVTRGDLAVHARHGAAPRQTVAISGAGGLVGSALAALLTTGGHRVVRLVRRPARTPEEIHWDPAAGLVDPAGVAPFDALVHLAGENIGAGRWTRTRRAAIRASRVEGTRALMASLGRMPTPPRTVVVASAVGWYGDRGDESLDESAASGTGFLAEVCRDWEVAAQEAEAHGARVALARFGVVLTPAGGALAKLRTPFSLGLGGPIGRGGRWMSWIAHDDAIGVLHEAIMDPRYVGAFNAVAPEAVTNRAFTAGLGRVLRRPTLLPLPPFLLKWMFGEMAEQTLLASTRVVPARLAAWDYPFRHPTLEGALRHGLGRLRAEDVVGEVEASDLPAS